MKIHARAVDTRDDDLPDLGDLPLDRLTTTERVTFEAAARGLSNREIAAERGVSRHTVDTQLRAAYEKLNIGNAREWRAQCARVRARVGR